MQLYLYCPYMPSWHRNEKLILPCTLYNSTLSSDFDTPNCEYRLLLWPSERSNPTFNSLLHPQLLTTINKILTLSHAIQITTHMPGTIHIKYTNYIYYRLKTSYSRTGVHKSQVPGCLSEWILCGGA